MYDFVFALDGMCNYKIMDCVPSNFLSQKSCSSRPCPFHPPHLTPKQTKSTTKFTRQGDIGWESTPTEESQLPSSGGGWGIKRCTVGGVGVE